MNKKVNQQIIEQARKIVECPIQTKPGKAWYGFWENTLVHLYNEKNSYYFEVCKNYLDKIDELKVQDKKINGRSKLGKTAKMVIKNSMALADTQWKLKMKKIAQSLLEA